MQGKVRMGILAIAIALGITGAASTISYAAKPQAAPEPELLFDFKTSKKIDRINILGENGDLVFLQNGANLYMHDGTTGAKLWEVKVPKYAGDGLDLIWNEELFITSIKKGMICYNLRNGEVLWQTDTSVKMKTFIEYFNFNTAFILRFEDRLVSFYPQTGEILWEAEDLWDPSRVLGDAGHANIYSFDREYGGRLLLLEDLAAYIYDAATGDMLSSVALEFTKKNAEPVAELSNDAIVLFYNEGTTSLNLKDGTVRWKMDDEVDPKRGYITFENSVGEHYAAFGFKNAFAVVDLDNGERLWETDSSFGVRPIHVSLLDDSTLFVTGMRKSLKPVHTFGKAGSIILACAFDLRTGTKKYDPYALVYSPMAAIDVFGFVNEYVDYLGPYKADEDWIFYVYAPDAKNMEDPDLKQEGGEGLVRMNPATGEVKYHTNFVLFDSWAKELRKAGVDVGTTNRFKETGLVPEPVFDETGAYISTGNGLAKLDIVTGETIWTSPDYSIVRKISLADGRVFGPIGYASWSYNTDLKKTKAADVIHQTKRGGYYVLDAMTGEEIYTEESKKNPTSLHLDYYNPANHQVYLSDGEMLRGLNVVDGSTVWSRNLRKDKDFLMGEISAKEGVVFILTGIETDVTSNYYSITTTTTKSYDVSMEHGLFPQEDGSILVLSQRGIGRLNGDGTVDWRTPWEWKGNKIQFAPTVTPKGMLYQYGSFLRLVSLEDGSVLWQTRNKRAKDVDVQIDKQMSKIFFIDNKTVSCIHI